MSQRSRNKRNKAKSVTHGNTALLERAEPQDKTPIPLYEARGAKRGGAALSKAFSLAWDETEAMGITADMRRSGPGMLSDQDRKETLYQAYLNSVWISACVDVIAKRITSGGMVIELTEKGTENQAEYDILHEFLHYINDDEDFLQLIRAIATDLLIYGEAYLEIVCKAGVPFSLHKIDCSTMNYKLDKHGTVTQYIQNMTHSTDTVLFEPDEIIRFWLPDPKAQKKALSPIERILGPTDTDAHMADWVRAFFRKGARPPFWIEFPGSKEEASRFVVWLRENYTGQANAHVPMVLYDGAKLNEIGKGSVDMDFTKGRSMTRQEILAGYQVPPAAVSQIESGNIGGGTGESQDNSLISNACDPLKSIIFEKVNYRIVQKKNGGFGITNWRVTTQYKNLQAKSETVKTDDTRIRNGSATVNEIRAESGKPPVEGGDEAVIVASRDIVPVARLKSLPSEQAQSADVANQQAQAQLNMTKVQVDKAKNPPPPPPTIVHAPPPENKKPVPDGKEQQQEHHLLALQQAIAHTNETLARADEHLLIARNAHTHDEETISFKQTLINELQWLKEQEDAFSDQLKQELAELRSLIEAKQEILMPVYQGNGILTLAPDAHREANSYYEGYKAIQNETPPEKASKELPGRETVVVDGTRSDQTLLQQESDVDTSKLDNRPEVVQHHTGIMIALNVDPETANQLAIPGGEPASESHITLCYLGDVHVEPEPGKLHPAHTQDTIKTLLSGLAATSEPLHGVVGGLARFLPSESSDWLSPVIALVNVHGLQQWRRKLVDALDTASYFVAQEFDYSPHLTLSYIAPDAPMPITTIPALPLDFYGMELCIGDDCTYFPFGGGETPHEETAQSTTETSPEVSPTTEQTSETREGVGITDHLSIAQDDEQRKSRGIATEDETDAIQEYAEATDTWQPSPIQDDNIDIIEEQPNAEQETTTQSIEIHDESTSENEAQSDGSLHSVQEPGDTSDSGTAESDIGDAESESSDTEEASGDSGSTSVVETQSLEAHVTALFESVYTRGTNALESGGSKDAYLFAESDKDALVHLLASAYLDAKAQAYQRAQDVAGKRLIIKKPWKSGKTEQKKAASWAQTQVESIASTYRDLLNSQLEDITEEAISDGVKKIVSKVKEWIHKFIPWKSKQIADNTQLTGDNVGTAQWIDDAGSAEGDPNGVRVRVVPENSSSDFCQEWAGRDFSLEDADSIPDFPAHSNCIHSIEVYLVEGNE